AIGRVISVALSRGFPRVGVTHRPALWCPDFPRRGFLSPPRSARPAPSRVAPGAGSAKRPPDMVAGMRTAVVTGAGSGLGRATALELAGRGFAVWAADLDGAAASETAA